MGTKNMLPGPKLNHTARIHTSLDIYGDLVGLHKFLLLEGRSSSRKRSKQVTRAKHSKLDLEVNSNC